MIMHIYDTYTYIVENDVRNILDDTISELKICFMMNMVTISNTYNFKIFHQYENYISTSMNNNK